MTRSHLDLFALALLGGLGVMVWHYRKGSSSSSWAPPASSLYHPVNNPNGFVQVAPNTWQAVTPNGDVVTYDAGLGGNYGPGGGAS